MDGEVPGPSRSRDVEPGGPDAGGGDDERPVGAGPDRSNDVLGAPVVPVAAAADRWAEKSGDDGPFAVSDRAAAPDRGAGSDRVSLAGRVE